MVLFIMLIFCAAGIFHVKNTKPYTLTGKFMHAGLFGAYIGLAINSIVLHIGLELNASAK